MGIHIQFAESKACCHCINFRIIVSVLLTRWESENYQASMWFVNRKTIYSFVLFLVLVLHALWIIYQQRDPIHSIKSFPSSNVINHVSQIDSIKNFELAHLSFHRNCIRFRPPCQWPEEIPIGMLHRFCFVCVYYRNVRAPTFFDTFYEKWQWHREHLPICGMQMVYRVFCF